MWAEYYDRGWRVADATFPERHGEVAHLRMDLVRDEGPACRRERSDVPSDAALYGPAPAPRRRPLCSCRSIASSFSRAHAANVPATICARASVISDR